MTNTASSGLFGLDDWTKKTLLSIAGSGVLFGSSVGFYSWITDLDADDKYGNDAIAGFMAGTFFLAVALFVAANTIPHVALIRGSNKDWWFISLLVASFGFGLAIFVSWKGYVYLSQDTKVHVSPIETLLSLIFFVSMLVLSLMSLVVWVHTQDEPLRIRNASEDTPLLAQSLELSESLRGGLEYIPSSYRKEGFAQRDFAFLAWIVALFAMFVGCTILPPSWTHFSVSSIHNWTSRSHHPGLKDVWRWSVSSTRSLVLYPDVCLFYGFLIGCALCAYTARKSLWFRIEMRRTRALFGIIITQGEWVFFWTLHAAMLCMCLYWFAVKSDTKTGYSHNGLYRTATGFGRMSCIYLAMSLFPTARNSVTPLVFGVSYEVSMKTHKLYARLFLACLFLHVLFWIAYLGVNNKFWKNVLFSPLPYSMNQNDFTLPIAYFVTCFVIVPVFGILSYKTLREKHYEVFYYSHIIGTLVVLLSLVWHISVGWYFVLPAICILGVDQLMRAKSQSQHVTLRRLERSDTVLKMTLEVEKTGEFGQYFRVNVPSVARLEWHPICVHSYDKRKQRTVMIVQRGRAGEWSDRLFEIDENSTIRLDGPYGVPLNHDAYRKILVIVDGIGFAPVMGFFAEMLSKAVHDETQLSVDLVWITEDPHTFLLFAEQLKQYAEYFDNDPDRLFDAKLCYTDEYDLRDIRPISSALGGLTLEHGFPDLIAELNYIEPLGSFTLVIGYGSAHLLRQCRMVALRYGAHHRCEPFNS